MQIRIHIVVLQVVDAAAGPNEGYQADPVQDPVRVVAWSPSARQLAIGSDPRGLVVVDPETGREEFAVRRAWGREGRRQEARTAQESGETFHA